MENFGTRPQQGQNARQLTLDFPFSPQPPLYLDPYNLPLECYRETCPYCGSIETSHKESRRTKRKGAVDVWRCCDCGRKFTPDLLAHAHVSLGALASIVDGIAKGKTLAEVAKEAGLRSAKTLPSLLGRATRLLKDMERLLLQLYPPKAGGVWYIDEMAANNKRTLWVVNVMDRSTRYWVSTYVAGTLDGRAVYGALKQATANGFPEPRELRSDRLQAHFKAAKKVLPTTKLVAKAKAKNPSFINLIERLQEVARATIGRKFRTPESAQNCLELRRFYYNFVMIHGGVGETPAGALGFRLPDFRDLGGLLKYALRLTTLARRGIKVMPYRHRKKIHGAKRGKASLVIQLGLENFQQAGKEQHHLVVANGFGTSKLV